MTAKVGQVERLNTAATITANVTIPTGIQAGPSGTTKAMRTRRNPAPICTGARTRRNWGRSALAQMAAGMSHASQSASSARWLAAKKSAGGTKITSPAASSANAEIVRVT